MQVHVSNHGLRNGERQGIMIYQSFLSLKNSWGRPEHKRSLKRVLIRRYAGSLMLMVTHQNTLFTQACWSEDRVNASAVCCISWCTLMGLSFEHTDLFLVSVSEKALVESYGGSRLKICPVGLGWAMLSDRGFCNTAWFYSNLNLNRQMMPKFLRGRK